MFAHAWMSHGRSIPNFGRSLLVNRYFVNARSWVPTWSKVWDALVDYEPELANKTKLQFLIKIQRRRSKYRDQVLESFFIGRYFVGKSKYSCNC